MKTSILFLLGIALLFIGPASIQAKPALSAAKPSLPEPPPLSTTYDAATDKTTVQSPSIMITGGARIIHCSASYSYSGKIPQRPVSVTFRMSTSDEKRQVWIEDDGHIYFTFGHYTVGAPHEQESSDNYTTGNNRVQTETNTSAIPVDLFGKIFAAAPVIIGLRGLNTPDGVFHSHLKEDYPLTGIAFAAFHALAASIPPLPKGPGPATSS